MYGTPKHEKPFFVRAIWHDGQFTYIKSDAHELPALYEMKDGAPALVNFKVAERHVRRAEGSSSAAISRSGKERFSFAQQGR